jgi:hypothetical protein
MVAVRALMALSTVAAALATGGCAAGTATAPATATASLPPDPQTAPALLAIATAFNRDYDTGD